MPNWAWFVLGVLTGLLWLGGSLIYVGWRVIIREKRFADETATTIDRVIVRDIGTLTYSRSN